MASANWRQKPPSSRSLCLCTSNKKGHRMRIEWSCSPAFQRLSPAYVLCSWLTISMLCVHQLSYVVNFPLFKYVLQSLLCILWLFAWVRGTAFVNQISLDLVTQLLNRVMAVGMQAYLLPKIKQAISFSPLMCLGLFLLPFELVGVPYLGELTVARADIVGKGCVERRITQHFRLMSEPKLQYCDHGKREQTQATIESKWCF